MQTPFKVSTDVCGKNLGKCLSSCAEALSWLLKAEYCDVSWMFVLFFRFWKRPRGACPWHDVAGDRRPLQRHKGSGGRSGGRRGLGGRQEPGDHQVGRDNGALDGGGAGEGRGICCGRRRLHGRLDGSQQGPVHSQEERQGRVKRRRMTMIMMMMIDDDDDDDGLAPPWANRERLPADLCLPIKLHSALNVVTIQRSRLWRCKYSIQYHKYSVESRITRCFEPQSGFIKSYSCDSEWDSYVWKWISGSRPITWTRIHFSTWWTTSFFFFFYLFTIQTDAVAVPSSLHSLQTTHIWWSVSELRCWFFYFIFLFFFVFKVIEVLSKSMWQE